MNLDELISTGYPIFQIGASVIVFIAYLIIKRILTFIVSKRALLHNFDDTRSLYIRKFIRAMVSVLLLVALGIIWEISIQGLSVYIASFLTIVGVGLFANWSIVSNITASAILFFFFPFKIGSKVRIVDGDNSVEGVVKSISMFSIRIQPENESQEVYYPNNIAIQKSIVHIKD